MAKGAHREPHNAYESKPVLKVIEPKTITQSKYLKQIDKKIITFGIGPPGTGKTLLAVFKACQLLANGAIDKIILTKPVIDCGPSLGFLPGPQPLDAKVLTPKGWTTMGSLKEGDFVTGRDGKPALVQKIFPQGKKEVVRITTTDNTSTECCWDHPWITQNKNEKKHNLLGKLRSTREIAESLSKDGKPNHYLPRNEAIQFDINDETLKIPPYVLGCLIGDGSLSTCISLSNTDTELINRCSRELEPFDLKLQRYSENRIEYTIVRSDKLANKPARPVKLTDIETEESYIFSSTGVAEKTLGINRSTIANRCRKKTTISKKSFEFLDYEVDFTNPIKESLLKYGLLGKTAKDKFIPTQYKTASIENRIALLQGLMDTDGTIKSNGEAMFCTTSFRLANDIAEVVRSLGGRVKLPNNGRKRFIERALSSGRKIKPGLESYEFNISLPENINPFYISRKASRHSCNYIHDAKIASIEVVGEKEVRCILINNKDHLYITDDFIVTHNTADEKVDPYYRPLYDALCFVLPRDKVLDLKSKGFIEIAPVTYLRGRTLDKSFIIIDDSQNLTRAEFKLILTRIGQNSKMVFTGDPAQIDLYYRTDSGLIDVVDALDYHREIGVTKFTSEDIQRNCIIGEILDALEEKFRLVKSSAYKVEETTAAPANSTTPEFQGIFTKKPEELSNGNGLSYPSR